MKKFNMANVTRAINKAWFQVKKTQSGNPDCSRCSWSCNKRGHGL